MNGSVREDMGSERDRRMFIRGREINGEEKNESED
jgi:hypothetical protein